MSQRHIPWWEAEEKPATSFTELLTQMAHEAVGRLVFEDLEPEEDKHWTFMRSKGLTDEDANSVCLFAGELRDEVMKVAVLLGYGLAKTDPGLGSYQDWMERALTMAGLGGYTCPVKWWNA